MDFTFIGQPEAGEQFSFFVFGDKRNVQIDVFLDGLSIYSHECPDPPCHETIVLDRHAGGLHLKFVAIAPNGETISRELLVLKKENPQEQQQTMTN